MANPLYARMQATAQRLIAKYGQAGTVTRIAPPDPVNGGDPLETAYPATLVPMAYDARNIDGTVIKTGDVQIYISAVGLAITPQVDDIATSAARAIASSTLIRTTTMGSRTWSSLCRGALHDLRRTSCPV